MLTLCLDTSGSWLNMAVCSEGRVLVGLSKEIGAGHSEVLMDEMGKLIKDAGIGLPDIGLLAVTNGPGSFTGLRVGIAFIKGLSTGLGLPAVPMNTLDAMACSQPLLQGAISPMIDAKKKEIYTSLYRMDGGRPARQGDYISIAPQKWLETLPQGTVIFGSGEANYRELFAGSGKLQADKEFLASKKMLSGMAVLSSRIYKDGGAIEADQLDAFYIRSADAELKH